VRFLFDGCKIPFLLVFFRPKSKVKIAEIVLVATVDRTESHAKNSSFGH
jgi:hypothetical protein